MKLNLSKEWLRWAAETDGDSNIGAGAHTLTDGYVPQGAVEVNAREKFERMWFCVQLLTADFGKVLTRTALEGALILFLRDDLRRGLLGQRSLPSSTSMQSCGVISELEVVLRELKISGLIEIDNNGVQQLIKGISPFAGRVSKRDQLTLSEVRQVFESLQKSGQVIETEDVLDAQRELVPQ